MSDLIILVADNDMEQTIRGLLKGRRNDLQIKDIDFEINRHPYRDSGCFSSADEFLRPFINQFDYAMVIFDHHGSGQENRTRSVVEEEVETVLTKNGWADRNCVVTIKPELENWIWVQPSELEPIIGWNFVDIELSEWLNQKVNLTDINKPVDPKEILEDILEMVQKPRSARIYRDVAETATLHNCRDESFLKFRATLQKWFSDDN